MAIDFLDEETDQKPFFVRQEELKDILEHIDTTKKKIHDYFVEHPKAFSTIFTPEKIKERATEEALTYFNFEEDGIQPDIIPQALQTEKSKILDDKQLKIALAYREANMFVREAAHQTKPEIFLDGDLVHRIYAKLFSADAGIGQSLYSFRNSSFPIEPEVVGDVFSPVPNKDVPSRMNDLFFKYNYDWFDEHTVIKAAKFTLEYYRIQPKIDGNKRTALLCMNFILEKDGYPSIFIDNSQKEQLFNSIKKGLLTRDVTDLAKLFAHNIELSQNKIVNDITSYRLNIRENEQSRESEPGQE